MHRPTPASGRLLAIPFLAFFLWSCSTPSPEASNLAEFTILHWNDFHAHNLPYDVSGKDSATGEEIRFKVGGTSNLVAYLDHLGRGRKNVAVLFGGDDFQGPPVSGLTKGRSQIELMNLVRPDAAVLGNHEFDYGLQQLRASIKEAKYPILAANLYDSLSGTTLTIPAVIREYGRIRVGLIGLLPPDLPILTLASTLVGTRMLDIDSVLTVYITRLKDQEKANLIVVLSHMGVGVDTLLAARRTDIDIIIGGHTHTALFAPIKKGRTLIVQAGSWGRYVGKLDCVVDLRADSITSYRGELVETRFGVYPVDSLIQQKVTDFESLVEQDLNTVIGTLMADWRTSFDEESNTGNWEADVFREFAGTDIGLVNSGGLRKSMFAGPITKRDIWEMNPFGNTLVTFTLSGNQLLQMLEWQASKKAELMQISGLRYTYDPDAPAGRKVIEATVDSRRVDPQRSYTAVTNNFVAGHAKDLLGVDPGTIADLYAIDRDVLIDYVLRHGTISSTVEGRIVRSGQPLGKENR